MEKSNEIKLDFKIFVCVLMAFFVIEPIFIMQNWVDIFIGPKSLFIWISIPIIFLFLFLTNSFSKLNKKLLITVIFIIVLLFINVISIINSPFISQSTKIHDYIIFGRLGKEEGLTFWFFNVFFLIVGFIVANSGIDKLEKVLNAMIFSSVLVSINGISQFIFSQDLFIWGFNHFKKYYYCFSTLGNQNFVGNFLSIIIPINIIMYLKCENKKKYLYLLTFIINLTCIVCSRTRGSWIGLFFGIITVLIYCVLKNRKFLKKLMILFFSLFIILLCVNVATKGGIVQRGYSVIDTTKQAAKGDESAGSARMYVWKVTLKYLEERPILGWGPNSFQFFFPNDAKKNIKYWGEEWKKVDKAHNEYLHIAVTTGIPSAIVYILFLIYIMIIMVKRFDNIYVCGFLSTLISYSIALFFSFSLPMYSIWFFLILGMAIEICNKKENISK